MENQTLEAIVDLEDAESALQLQIGRLKSDFLKSHGWTFELMWTDSYLWVKRINGRVVLQAHADQAIEVERNLAIEAQVDRAG